MKRAPDMPDESKWVPRETLDCARRLLAVTEARYLEALDDVHAKEELRIEAIDGWHAEEMRHRETTAKLDRVLATLATMLDSFNVDRHASADPCACGMRGARLCPGGES